MYTIKSSQNVTGRHWGLKFQDGIAETDDAVLAEKLSLRGYTVTKQGAAPVEPCDPLTCGVCGKTYKTSAALAKHLKTHE